ncbi:MAG: AAA family ATPase [Candidatus Magnetobacterium sp. LHC-1]|nr:AAA family ATPase [Nitrospirota bacterium]
MTDPDVYITKVKIHNVRHLKDIDIPLSDTGRKHLIFTGINGSGKTSVLEAIKEYLGNADNTDNTVSLVSYIADNYYFGSKDFLQDEKLQKEIRKRKEIFAFIDNITKKTGVELFFNHDYLSYSVSFAIGKCIAAFFKTKRGEGFLQPKGANKLDFKKQYDFSDKAGYEFTQHIFNLQVDRLFAEKDNDIKTVNEINNWFIMFEQSLKKIFEDNDIKLEFDRKNYDHYIIKKGRERFTFNQLSDGYLAIFDIVLELIMRMEPHRTNLYDIQGIVLIDEIETHLHVSLQKGILPFLTSFFPRIQFIVTTHSPFVLSSIENAVICDLENNIIDSDFSGYSYDGIIESYFDIDKYSQDIKDKIERYEHLADLEMLTEEDEDKLFKLEMYLKGIPAFLAPELKLKFQQVELALLLKNIKNGKR